MLEYYYICPYCFSEVSLLIDRGSREQQIIEDCERCCNPIEFEIALDDELQLLSVDVRKIDQ